MTWTSRQPNIPRFDSATAKSAWYLPQQIPVWHSASHAPAKSKSKSPVFIFPDWNFSPTIPHHEACSNFQKWFHNNQTASAEKAIAADRPITCNYDLTTETDNYWVNCKCMSPLYCHIRVLRVSAQFPAINVLGFLTARRLCFVPKQDDIDFKWSTIFKDYPVFCVWRRKLCAKFFFDSGWFLNSWLKSRKIRGNPSWSLT